MYSLTTVDLSSEKINMLFSPSSRRLLLVANSSRHGGAPWTDGVDIGDVTTVFDQDATSRPGGKPVSGTFKPKGEAIWTFSMLTIL
jgi:hypothetical protein